MAVFKSQVLLLCIAIGSLVEHIALVRAESRREGTKINVLHLSPQDAGAENDKQTLLTRNYWNQYYYPYYYPYYYQHYPYYSTSGGGNVAIGNIGTDGITSVGGSSATDSGSDYGNIMIRQDANDLILRILNSGKKGISKINNVVYYGDKLIYSNWSKKTARPTHQKTPDGARWYANIKIPQGQPMTPAEADNFDRDYAQAEKKLKGQYNKRMEAMKKRLQQQLWNRTAFYPYSW